MDVAAFLQEVDFFQSTHPDIVARIAAGTPERRFAAGTTILRRGEPGDCMYLIVDGEVEVPVFDAEGEQRFIVRLGSKQIFGEMALLTGEARSADVVAVSECRCLVFLRDAVERLIEENTDVAHFLTALLGQRLVRSGAIRKVGKYQLLGELGRGGMSIVYEGIHPGLQRTVAIKMLSHRKVCHPQFSAQFQNEAKIISRLRHPHILEVYDTEQAYRTYFIIMERLSGRPLSEILETYGSMPPARVREVVRQIASALDLAHRQGIVHRDIKPSNIMITDGGPVKLMDFGLALESGGPPDSEGTVAGTPRYMAPEQIRGEPLDGRTDIYALGLVTYMMLTGDVPFPGNLVELLDHHENTPVPSPRARNPAVTDDLEQFVLRAAAKRPADRFQSCAEVLAFFETREPSGPDFSRLGVETLTFLYPTSREMAVRELIEEILRRARNIQDLEVR